MRLLTNRYVAVKLAALIVSFGFIASCDSNSSSDSDDGAGDSTVPTAQVNPASASTINGEASIIVTFDSSMTTSSKSLGGSLSSESDGGVWSRTTLDNDTLTIMPATSWTAGNQTLTVDADSSNGASLNTLSLQYTVDTALEVKSITPSDSSTIKDQRKIIITFDEPVDKSTLAGGGTMWPESDSGTWSTVSFEDDTLTIKPAGMWTVGGQTLSVTIADMLGNSKTILLNYMITTDADADGVTAAAGDCDDSDASIYPGATEVCDGVDNNCDGAADESGALGESTFYIDVDGDGYGDSLTSIQACVLPASYVSDATDCDDNNSSVSPGTLEVCDGLDNDCDSTADNGVTPPSDPCEWTNQFGTCTGNWICGGINGWTCDAPEPDSAGQCS